MPIVFLDGLILGHGIIGKHGWAFAAKTAERVFLRLGTGLGTGLGLGLGDCLHICISCFCCFMDGA